MYGRRWPFHELCQGTVGGQARRRGGEARRGGELCVGVRRVGVRGCAGDRQCFGWFVVFVFERVGDQATEAWCRVVRMNCLRRMARVCSCRPKLVSLGTLQAFICS